MANRREVFDRTADPLAPTHSETTLTSDISSGIPAEIDSKDAPTLRLHRDLARAGSREWAMGVSAAALLLVGAATVPSPLVAGGLALTAVSAAGTALFFKLR